MKKYIAAVLINALLLQFVGCYSQREIYYEEFYSLPKQQEAKLITKDEKRSNFIQIHKQIIVSIGQKNQTH